jgi:hypothetical protein
MHTSTMQGTFTIVSEPDVWSLTNAMLFPSVFPNTAGSIGGTFYQACALLRSSYAVLHYPLILFFAWNSLH